MGNNPPGGELGKTPAGGSNAPNTALSKSASLRLPQNAPISAGTDVKGGEEGKEFNNFIK